MMPTLRGMLHADLESVLQIEQQIHAYPWTRGNFSDALDSNYVCRVYEENEEMAGYAVLMAVRIPGVDEAHLLTIGIATAYQRQGLGRRLLEEMLEIARGLNMRRVILEVRPSNVAALQLYRRAGFTELATRRGYYPSGVEREDAIVMEYSL